MRILKGTGIFYGDADLYAKPALSMIAEERSPIDRISPLPSSPLQLTIN